MNVWEIHPALVHFPIALLLSAVALDVFAWWRPSESLNRMAIGLLIAGVVAGWLAANFGLLAFYTVPAHTHDAHHLMFWHIGAAVSTLLLFTWLAVVRWFHRAEPITRPRRIVGLIAAAFLMTTGALGGHIVYHGGAGVQPELLAESVREAHSHGGVAGQEKREGHGQKQDGNDRESYRSAYQAQTPAHEHSKADQGSKHGEGHEDKPMAGRHATGKKADEVKTDTGHADHRGRSNDQEKTNKTDRPDKAHHEEDSAAEPDERQQAPDRESHGHQEHSDKEAPAADEKHEHHGEAKPRTDEKKKEDAPAHQHGSTHPSASRPKDPALGPDFERNVQENRQRNMPKMDDHSKMGHGSDHKTQKPDGDKKQDESGSKHQH